MKINFTQGTRLLLPITLSMSISLNSFASESKWKDTGFDLNAYKSLVPKESCLQTEQSYMGCIVSLNTLLSQINPLYKLEKADSKSKVILQNKVLSIVQSSKVDAKEITSFEEAYKENKKYHSTLKEKYLALREEFNSTKASDIDAILQFLEKNTISISEETVAEAVNEFIHTAQDPHSDFRLAADNEAYKTQGSVTKYRLGVGLKQSDTGLTVTNVEPNSPAAAQSIQAFDTIAMINDIDLKNENSLQKFIDAIQESNGQKVKLKIIKSQTKSILSIEVAPEKVTAAKIVDSRSLTYTNLSQKTFGYVRYSNFVYENGCSEVKSALESFNKQKVAGLILDLRNNPGGSVAIAQCIAGLFIGPDKVISYFDSWNPYTKVQPSISRSVGQQVFNKPLVVLINAYSASASELISGAFRDHNRALIIGQTSFGKGSSQSPQLDQNGQILKIKNKVELWKTNGLFYQPVGKSNQNVGITPHISVFRNPDHPEMEQFALRESDMFLYPLKTKFFLGAEHMPNANTIAVPQSCVDKANSLKEYQNNEKSADAAFYHDHQILTAISALDCSQ